MKGNARRKGGGESKVLDNHLGEKGGAALGFEVYFRKGLGMGNSLSKKKDRGGREYIDKDTTLKKDTTNQEERL